MAKEKAPNASVERVELISAFKNAIDLRFLMTTNAKLRRIDIECLEGILDEIEAIILTAENDSNAILPSSRV